MHVTEAIGPAICWSPSGYRLLRPDGTWNLLSPVQRDLVMRHELAHLQRGDLWKALFYRLIAALQWFNPLAWLAVRKLAECAEWSCDDFARSSEDCDSAEYVRALLECSRPSHGVPSLVPTAAGHSLVRRAERLLTPTLMEDSGMKKLSLALAVAALAMMNALPVELVAQQATPPAVTEKEPAPESPLPTEGDNLGQVIRVQDLGDGDFALVPTEAPRVKLVELDGQKCIVELPDLQGIAIGAVVPGQMSAEPSSAVPPRHYTKEAVIDMAFVFANLPQCKQWRDESTKEAVAMQESMMAEAEALQELVAKISSAQGSEADRLRTELAMRTATHKVEKAVYLQKIHAMDSDILVRTYKLVRKAVAAYAIEHEIQIVRRMSGERPRESQLDSGDPQAVLQAMNAQGRVPRR